MTDNLVIIGGIDFDWVILGGGFLLLCYLMAQPKRAYATEDDAAKSAGNKVSPRGATRVLKNPKVKLIFWGNWANAKPSIAEIDQLMKLLIASNYFDAAAQYGAGKPVYTGYTTNTNIPPPNFSDKELVKCVNEIFAQGKAPFDPEMIYYVIPQKGRKSYFQFGTVTAWHAQLTHITVVVYYGSYTQRDIMEALAEEIVESIADPWRTSTGSRGFQIGDLCDNDPHKFTINGLRIKGYWSNKDNRCISG